MKAYFALFTTLILWASAFVGISAVLVDFSPINLAIIRFIVAIFALLFFIPFMHMKKILARDMWRFILAGLFGIAGYNLLLNFGQQNIDPPTASLIINTVPCITVFLSWVCFYDKPSMNTIISMIICFSGAVVIAFAKGMNLSWTASISLVFGAAICQSIYFILIKPLFARYNALQVTLFSIICGVIFMLPFGQSILQNIQIAKWSSLYILIYLGVFPAAIAYFLWSVALSKMNANYAASFLFLVPIFTFIINWLIFGKTPSLYSIIGGLIILCGLVIYNKHSLFKGWILKV